VSNCRRLECLNTREIGFSRNSKFFEILESESSFLAEQSERNERLIDNCFAIFDVFMKRVKEFEFVFEDKFHKLSFAQLKKAIQNIKFARDQKELVFFKDKLQTGMFLVDCSEVRVKLDEQIHHVITNLVSSLISKISLENEKLARDVEEIENELSGEVETVDELEKSRNYAQNIEDVLAPMMKNIREIIGKMDLVEDLQYRVPEDDFRTAWKSFEFPARVKNRSKRALMRLDRREKELVILLKKQQEKLDHSIATMSVEFDTLTQFSDLDQSELASKHFIELRERLEGAVLESKEIQKGERITQQQKTSDYTGLHELVKHFSPYYKFWEYASNYKYKYLENLEKPLEEIVKAEFTIEINEVWTDLFRMEKSDFKVAPHMMSMSKKLRERYAELKPYIPLVADLKNESMKNRHWKDILSILKMVCDVNEIQKVTFRQFLNHGAIEARDQIKEISEIASKENSFVRLLSNLRQEWRQISFEYKEFRNTGKYILKNVEPVMDKLDEDIAKLSSILSSPYIKFLESDIVSERTILINIHDNIETWIKVQKHWQYLQPIFSSEDIIKQRPAEALKFNTMDYTLTAVMDHARESSCVPEVCKNPKLNESLESCLRNAEEIIKSLNDYLNQKRQAFPRFYFLPNEELLTILAQTKDVRMIQKFLNKCFEGIETLTFTPDNIITGMNSIMGEKLDFGEEIDPFEEPGVPRNVEEWLKEVEKAMKLSLKDYYLNALEAYSPEKKMDWLFQWPAQIIMAIGQTLWTSEVEDSCDHIAEHADSLDQAYKHQNKKLMDIVQKIQTGDFGARDTMTLEVLIVLEVHGLDVIDTLRKNKIQGKDHFDWTSQLRYYWVYYEKEKTHKLNARMIITERQYGWEYLGNQGRLVITPLTDRCYRTLMSALHMNLGGAPEGPAGTGKTETTKDLAKALAKHCVVFNCSDELDIGQMSKFFMGLTSCGSWACFDEFNRIELEVLSVIAQQILQIQTAILIDSEAKIPARQFMFCGSIVNLDPTCAVFITMNPGYAGRSELPDNLKRLFRPIAMMIPNYSMIAEISLYSYGYQNARDLSVKIVQSLRLSSEQLSSQFHYDFGMRSVKTILVAAGNLKRQYPEESEKALIIQAICDCTFPKFTSEDIPLFNNILDDLFPKEKRMDLDYGNIQLGIEKASKLNNVILEENFRAKIIQLYETIRVRHGLMVVGEPFSGKSSIIKTLKLGWELSDRIRGLRRRLQLEAKRRAKERKEKRIVRPSQMDMIKNIAILLRKNTQELDKEEPVKPASFDEQDPEYISFYNEIYNELLTGYPVEDLLRDRKGLGIRIDKINPKAIPHQLLYGIIDETSGDWKEGITAKIFKDCAEDESDFLRWIIFDGPVDAVWIENMNTVLDDNKKLCLANSEQIKLTNKMNIVFEVEDLAEASLATVSRCGMVYMEARQINKRSLFENWYSELALPFKSPEQYEYYDSLYRHIIETAFRLYHDPNIVVIEKYTEHHLLVNVLRYFQGLIYRGKNKADILSEIEAEREKQKAKEDEAKLLGIELTDTGKKGVEFGKAERSEYLACMIFSVLWGIGASIDGFSREYFSKLLTSELKTVYLTEFKKLQESVYPPELSGQETLFDYFYNFETKTWQPFVSQLNNVRIPANAKFNDIFIPTKDSVRNTFLMKTMLKQDFPFLFYGKTGTGKTQVVKRLILDELDPSKNLPTITVLSANTKREQVQDVLEMKLEKQKRSKGIFGPLVGTKNIIFIDDLNMPNKEKYGAQPPLELVRQALDDRGWYDRKTLEFKQIVDIQIVGGMGLGRPNIPNRLNRHFTTVHLFEYDQETIKHVYKCLIDHCYSASGMPEKVKHYSTKIASMCVNLYRSVCKDFKPLPGKSHYLFNLRDLSKVVQGVLSAAETELTDQNVALSSKFAKLFVYESRRVFSDRFVDQKDKDDFNRILKPVIHDGLQEPYDNLIKKDSFFVFGNFMEQNTIKKEYKEINSLEGYRAMVTSYIDEYNEINKQKINILLFQECLDNLAKLNRVLSREQGHALQVGLGGDGRRTLTRLATYMQGYQLREMDVQKDVMYNDWQDFLKEIFQNSGSKNIKSTILVTDNQLNKNIFYEDINNILNIGEIPNLITLEEKEGIMTDVKQQEMKQNRRSLSNPQAWELFLSNCKANMHLVLCVSPIGDSLRLRLRNFPSLVNCSSIIWYLPWANDSLRIIGMDALQSNEDGKELIQGREKELIDVFVEMHQVINEETKVFQKEMKKYNYVTPLNYRILLDNFNRLLSKKQQQLTTDKNRYESGVKKLDECAEYVEKTKKMLQDLAPQLIKKSKEAEIAFKKVEEETVEIEEKERLISKDRAAASEKQKIAFSIKAECDEKLSHATPILLNAQKQVESMDRGHLVEVKSMNEPPAKALIVLEGVLRLFGFVPKKTQDSNTFFKQTIKKELSNVDLFMGKLTKFKVENVPEQTINNVKTYIKNQPLFTEATAKAASLAFLILYHWVLALLEYYDVYQSIVPLRAEQAKAEESLEEANKSLMEKETELKVIQDKVDLLKQELENIQHEQSELSRSIRDCEIKLNRSIELNEKLSGERGRWEGQVEKLTDEINNVLGDIILACGYLSYLGPFTLDFREKIVKKKWIPLIDEKEIPNSHEKFTLENAIGNTMEIQTWNFYGLPFDSTSVENVLIMMNNSDKFPLVVDPQSQFMKFIKNYEKTKSTNITTIKANLEPKKLEDQIANCLRRGDTLIVESVGDNISSVFDDLIARNFTLQAGMQCVQVGSQQVEMDNNFKMYLVSNLNSPHYTPELLSKVVYLDFSVTPSGLQQQMISLVCKTEEPKDEEEKIFITREGMEFAEKQRKLELRILNLLTESRGNVVENDALINSLNESKSTSEDIKARLRQSAKTEEKIEKNRQNYKPLAHLVSNIFLIVKDLYKLDPMYQFSLKWFESVVVKTILATEKPIVKNPEKRVANLTDSLLRSLYEQICRSIFVKHKQLFSFLLASTLLKTEGKLNPDMWMIMLTEKGISKPSVSEQNEEEQVEELHQPDSISNVLWRKIEEINKIESFSKVKKSACDNPDQFLSFIEDLDKSDCFSQDAWPSHIMSDVTPFGSLVFIKIFRSDLFPKYVTEFVKITIGQYFNEDVIVSLDKTFEESSPTTPYIYILSPGDDPTEEIKKFAVEKSARITPISLGRGQGEQAERTIHECCQGNSWVLLQNCHLAISWLPNLERIIEEIGSEGMAKKLDKNFRLFLTAFSTSDFPISILQNGIKLTKDPPKGVKANMLQIYINQSSTKPEKKFFNDMVEQRVDDWRPLFMALSYFHAVIRERRRFGPVGWNIPYDFNESDFKISVKQLKYVLNNNPAEIPFKALIYLTSECYYGGKVTDNMDRRLLTCLLQDFYNSNAIILDYYFSENKDYVIPKEPMTLEEALEFIKDLPDLNDPQIYGLNSNASISSAINDTASMVENILTINPSSSESSVKVDPNIQIKSTMASVLKTLPENFDVEAVREIHPIDYHKCMNTVLIQELLRYNALLTAIKVSGQDLINAIEGTIVMTGPLEEMADKVQKNQIPAQWAKMSYPSLKPMMSYIEDLVLRLKMFKNWIENGQPKVYWVPGFHFTQSFFTGVLQDYARKQQISIDCLEFKHFIMPPDFDSSTCEEHGCYTSGLFMEAAQWDSERGTLEESVPKRVFFDMPIVSTIITRRSTSSHTLLRKLKKRNPRNQRNCFLRLLWRFLSLITTMSKPPLTLGVHCTRLLQDEES
jgi:dynein heavy chain